MSAARPVTLADRLKPVYVTEDGRVTLRRPYPIALRIGHVLDVLRDHVEVEVSVVFAFGATEEHAHTALALPWDRWVAT